MNRFQFKDICDECETMQKNLLICLTCEQTICLDCNVQVHNKGNRLKHLRLLAYEYFYRCAFNKKFIIYFLSFSIYKNYFLNREKLAEKICQVAYEKLIKRAKKGKPMILFSKLQKHLERILGKSELISHHLSECLLMTPQKPVFHKTERNLGNNIKIVYFSICLDEISLESLVWILKSIYLDKMEPNQVLIQSRFKEFFALKIPMKEWNIFVKELVENLHLTNKMNIYSNIFGVISVIKNQQDNFIFKIANLNWEYEDNSLVRKTDEDYQEFLKFINLFFDEDKNNKFLSFFENEKIGLSSVKNSKLRKNSTNSQNKLKTLLKTQNIKKAIPGGMYGCVLLLKGLNNKIFNKRSMGRLHALIKKALKDQIIIHYKTLIIKEKNKNPLNEKTKKYLIEEAKSRILIILEESGSRGITLAQMHNSLIKRFGKKYDFAKLGFPKLKNFLMTIDRVYLDHGDNINHIKAKLKKSKKKDLSLNQPRSHRDTRVKNYKKSGEIKKLKKKVLEEKNIYKKWIKDDVTYNDIYQKWDKKTVGFKKWNEDDKNVFNQQRTQSRIQKDHDKITSESFQVKDILIENFIINLLEVSKNGIEIESLHNQVVKNFGSKLSSKKSFLAFLKKNFTKIKICKNQKNQQIILFQESSNKSDLSIEFQNSLISYNSFSQPTIEKNDNSKINKSSFKLSGYSTPGRYNQQFGTQISLDNLNPFSSLHGRDFSNGFNQFTDVFDLSPHHQNDLRQDNYDDDEELNQELEKMVIKNINSIIDDNNN